VVSVEGCVLGLDKGLVASIATGGGFFNTDFGGGFFNTDFNSA
jgi:hypothetical protein